MCGIIGYIGEKPAMPILIDGLRRLEYRGYDSAGVAVMEDTIALHKTVGRIADLERVVPLFPGYKMNGYKIDRKNKRGQTFISPEKPATILGTI